jgi:zinc and cadmium transporter
VAFLVPFAAGNFIYIAAADLIPQITATEPCADPTESRPVMRDKIEKSLAFGAGLGFLLLTTLLK